MDRDVGRAYFVLFQKLEKELVKPSSGQTAASVHNFRRGASGVQTLFEELLPEGERNQEKLLKIVARLRRRAGKIHDLRFENVCGNARFGPRIRLNSTRILNSNVGKNQSTIFS